MGLECFGGALLLCHLGKVSGAIVNADQGCLGVPLWGHLGGRVWAGVGYRPGDHWGDRPVRAPRHCSRLSYQGRGET